MEVAGKRKDRKYIFVRYKFGNSKIIERTVISKWYAFREKNAL